MRSDYEQLWAIPQDQQQLATAVTSIESTPMPVYSNQQSIPAPPPPPPYTTHASIGEISIHRSYHHEMSLDQEAAMVVDGSQLCQQLPSQPGEVETVNEHDNAVSHDVSSALVHETELQAQSIGYHPIGLDDPQQVTEQMVFPPPLALLPATLILPPHVQTELPATMIANHPLATSTPTSSLSELNTLPNTADIFIRNELPPAPPATSQSPPKHVPLLRPIRPKHFSAPNLFVSYPSTPAPENDMLSNTMPRMSRLPPLRRKTAPNLPEIPHHIFNEDQTLKSRPYPRSVSACETIREVTSCSEASTESVNNS